MRFETVNLGIPGTPGTDGVDGASAYEIAVDNGFVGTEEEWLAGLIGPVGPSGGESGSINGLTALRGMPPVSGQTLHLNYHTTPGDLGGGQFRGVTTGGTYVDNNGTVIVPTGGDGSTAWLRVWDGMNAHVGWFGAKCDLVADDYIPANNALKLFTNGRTAVSTVSTGSIDFGPGIAFSQPLLYGGSNGCSIRFIGHSANAGAAEAKTTLKYTGPATDGAIVFYGAMRSSINDINVWPLLAYNGVLVIADNTFNHTVDNVGGVGITAGTDVVVRPSKLSLVPPNDTDALRVSWLQIGCWLGIDAGGDNFEIVYVTAVDTVAGTFTADFKKNHAFGVQIGGSSASSGTHINRSRLVCPGSPVYTTLKIPHTVGPGGGTEKVYTPETVAGPGVVWTPTGMTGIKPGAAVWIGNGSIAETVYVKSVTATTFTADGNQLHPVGSRIMLATSAILLGNRMIGTVQVSEIAFNDVHVFGGTNVNIGTEAVPITECTNYAGIRQIRGGNTKNITVHHLNYGFLKIVMALEESSGQYLVSGSVGSHCEDTIFLTGSACLTVLSLEDESLCYWLRGAAGASHLQATFIGCTFQGANCAQEMTVTDQMVVFSGNLTFVGCQISNFRKVTVPPSLPVIVMQGITSPTATASLTMIGCSLPQGYPLTAAGLPPPFITDVPLPSAGGVDVLAAGTGKVTLLGCTAGVGTASNVVYPTILPRLQGSAVFNPLSMGAGTIGATQTLSLPGAVLGDIIDISFSNDLAGATLRAWVSATDTVSYQFGYPAGSTPDPLDLPSGTVKCRVRK